ncbi:MerR family transcriptional regulator [Bacillus sp. 2205SS5-2]|uniref:MerR family transcriptional regulator n=1 Tax=Bacillus sp. 2205SS5-2 TaxID=3109031 RepID=UPI0030063A14
MEKTISQLAKDFSLSSRTLRYYEELELLAPKRESGRRIYRKKDVTRLKLIIRGKKYGFSLDEIKEMVLLFDQDPTGKQQLDLTIQYGEKKVSQIANRISELDKIKREMEERLEHLRQLK